MRGVDDGVMGGGGDGGGVESMAYEEGVVAWMKLLA